MRAKEYTDGYYRENHRQDEYYISATVLYRPLEALTLSLAQDGVINKLRNSLPECPFPTRYTSISAFNARYRQGWLTATASLVHTATSEHAEKGTVPDDFHRFAPSLSVSMQPWQDEALYFRLMYKTYVPSAHFNDLYYYRLATVICDPRRQTNIMSVSHGANPDCLCSTISPLRSTVTIMM